MSVRLVAEKASNCGNAKRPSDGVSQGTVKFDEASFASGEVNFNGAEFSGSRVRFISAKFSGGQVRFVAAKFTGSCEIDFRGANPFSRPLVVFGGSGIPPWVKLPAGHLEPS